MPINCVIVMKSNSLAFFAESCKKILFILLQPGLDLGCYGIAACGIRRVQRGKVEGLLEAALVSRQDYLPCLIVCGGGGV